MTKISVIVPVYNVENELERCVKSICDQTYKNLEIILVDDGSTDSSGIICDKLAKKDERIKVIHQKNGGLARARLTGFQKSSGGVVGFVDSDDYIEPDMYGIMLTGMQNTNAEIVFCGYNSITGNVNDKRYFTNSDKILDKDTALKYLANDEIKSFMVNKIYKRDILSDTDFYIGKLMEDFLCMTDIFNRCEIIFYCNAAFYNYVRRANSIMGNKSNMFKYWEACKFRFDWYKLNYPKYITLALNRVVRADLTCFENKNLNREQKLLIKQFLKNNISQILENKNLNLHKKLKVWYFLFLR